MTDDDPVRVLDADGRVLDDATVPDLDDGTLVDIHRDMLCTRHLDERAVSLQRQGRIGTFLPCAGQEAAQVASTHALASGDPICYQYREHGTVVTRADGPEMLADYLSYWMGHEAGNGALWERKVFPLNISIASHVPHAVGLAWAARLQGEDDVVACHFGDGATSEGDFHEGMNFAGVMDAPAVLVCNNNGWASSHPSTAQTASDTFAGKADAYGFWGVRVDGMDPLATYAVIEQAADKGRNPGRGERRPTLVEAVSYRLGAHTTADDPSRYRDDEELERWQERDPIDRYGAFLRERGLLDDEREDAMREAARETVAEAIERAESRDPAPGSLFDHAYADLPPAVERQREAFERLRAEWGDEAFLRDER
ncbi:MAG: thiamine pyrophosphate-dependent dehydrogenase E1 component subunit alpha [Haloferacaceae archaeon]